jgi:two-component system, OmpR family, sensor kinase
MRALSIRAHLTLWYVSLSTVIFLLLAGAAYGLLSYNLSHGVDAALDSVAKVMKERVTTERARGALTTFFPSEIDEVFRRFFGILPWERYFEMRDPMGHNDLGQPVPNSGKLPLSREALRNASRGLATFETVENLGRYPVRVLTVPMMEGSRMTNLIQVGMSLQSAAETRVRFLLAMAVLLPAGLVLAGWGGSVLARHALKPVERMAEAAHRIGAEHLNERVEETGTGDELDRLAITLNEMLSRLDSAFTQARRFSADASHELQTPLTILKGELEVALRFPRTADEYRATLMSAVEEVNRIAHLVEGLLLLHRAEAGALRIDRRQVDLEQLLKEVHGQLKVLADSRSIELRLGPLEPVSLQGDPELLRRLLLNLGDNAIKYTPPNGMVSLSLERKGRWASVLVSDTGIGIRSEEEERIFQPFYRTVEARSLAEAGTGLGLSIARSIALAHGGKIQIQSIPGQGSTFEVLIPFDS